MLNTLEDLIKLARNRKKFQSTILTQTNYYLTNL